MICLFQFSLNPSRDVAWSQLFRNASSDCPEIEWMDPQETFVTLPVWSSNVYLRSITIQEFLDAVAGQMSRSLADTTGPILSLPTPNSLYSLAALLSPWFNGKCLAMYEGPLDYPDPSRINHIITKFEVDVQNSALYT